MRKRRIESLQANNGSLLPKSTFVDESQRTLVERVNSVVRTAVEV